MKKMVIVFLIVFSFLLVDQPVWSESPDPALPGSLFTPVGALNSPSYQPLMMIQSKSYMGKFNAMCIFLADQLVRNQNKQQRNGPIIITTFADLNNLKETTAFGRLVAENLGHELLVRKWAVVDIRLTKDLLINDYGEFSLSRDVQKIRDSFQSGMVITGTYARIDDCLLVNVRLIDLNQAVIISSGQMMLVIPEFMEELLANKSNAQKTTKIVGIP